MLSAVLAAIDLSGRLANHIQLATSGPPIDSREAAHPPASLVACLAYARRRGPTRLRTAELFAGS